jgi:glutathione S-transferase
MAELDRVLGEREWLVGNELGLADIAAGSALGYTALRLADHPWRVTYPRLARYADRLEQRPSFQKSRPAPQTIAEIG